MCSGSRSCTSSLTASTHWQKAVCAARLILQLSQPPKPPNPCLGWRPSLKFPPSAYKHSEAQVFQVNSRAGSFPAVLTGSLKRLEKMILEPCPTSGILWGQGDAAGSCSQPQKQHFSHLTRFQVNPTFSVLLSPLMAVVDFFPATF